MVVRLRRGIPLDDDAAVDDRVRHARARVLVRIRPGAIRRLAIEKLAEQSERAAADADAPAAVHIRRGTVVRVTIRVISTDTGVQEWRELPFLQHHVDDARDRVRPVLRRGAVAQHVDAVDGARGNGVEIDAGRPGAHAVREGVDERHLMTAPAVDEHQRLIGREAAQRERPHDVVRVGDALMREVHRRCQRLQNLPGLGHALFRHVLRREHIDRDRELLRCGMPRPRSDHHVHRRQADRLLGEDEILRDGCLVHDDARGARLIAEQPNAQQIRAGRQAANLIAALIVARRAQAAAFGRDHRPGEGRARGIRNAAAHDAILCQHHCRQDQEKREYFADSLHSHASVGSDRRPSATARRQDRQATLVVASIPGIVARKRHHVHHSAAAAVTAGGQDI